MSAKSSRARSCSFVTPRSSSNAANAALVGAKTVNGPSPYSVVTKLASVSASTKMEKSSFPTAISTTVSK